MIDFFKKLYKTIKEFICSNVVDLFYSKSTQRVLMYSKRHSQGTLKEYLSTRRTFVGHSKGTLVTQDTRALEHVRHSKGNRWALGHSRHIGDLDT